MRKKYIKGFSLIELLVALGILAFCLIPIMQIIPSGGGLLSTARTENLNKCLFHAQAEIDRNKKILMNNFAASVNTSVLTNFATAEPSNYFGLSVVSSTATADGGDPGGTYERLGLLRVTVWRNLDGNTTRDAQEVDYVELNTKVCSREIEF